MQSGFRWSFAMEGWAQLWTSSRVALTDRDVPPRSQLAALTLWFEQKGRGPSGCSGTRALACARSTLLGRSSCVVRSQNMPWFARPVQRW